MIAPLVFRRTRR